MKGIDPTRRNVLRPEKPMLVIGGLAVYFGCALLWTLITDASTDDPWWWGALILFSLLTFLSVRAVLVRVVADDAGVEVVSVFRRRLYAWADIERFEVASGSGYAAVVTKDGKRHRLSGQRVSPAERLLSVRSHTKAVVATLNALLEGRQPAA